MKKVALAIAGICIFALAGLTVSACGEVAGDECSTNADCSGDDLCYTEAASANQCVVNCTPPGNTGACKDTEQCVAIGEDMGCVAKTDLPGDDAGTTDAGPGTDGTSGGCMDSSECDGAKVCDNGMCVDPPMENKFVQVKDNTDSGKDICKDSVDDPGADIFGAELLDSSGSHLGWGKFVVGNPVGKGNTHTKFNAIFDGTKSNLDTSSSEVCPNSSFGPDSVGSLGCGGAIVLGFQDGSGNYVTLKDGQELIVHEYGAQCCATAGACGGEKLSVTVCSAGTTESDLKGASPQSDGTFAACANTELASGGSGKLSTSVSLP